MQKIDGSFISEEDFATKEDILFTYDEKETQENIENKNNASLMWKPASVSFYPELLSYGLDIVAILTYSFIEYYLRNNKGKRFYFGNKHIASIFNVSESKITSTIKLLGECGLLSASYRIALGGGQTRFIKEIVPFTQLGTRLLKSTSQTLKIYESDSENLRGNNNNINNNNKEINNNKSISKDIEGKETQNSEISEKEKFGNKSSKEKNEIFNQEVELFLFQKKLFLDLNEKVKVAIWFGKKLTKKRIFEYSNWIKNITKIIQDISFSDFIEAMRKNQHNKRTMGLEDSYKYRDGKPFKWSLDWIVSSFKGKSVKEKIESSLDRHIDIQATKEELDLFDKIKFLVPNLKLDEPTKSDNIGGTTGVYNECESEEVIRARKEANERARAKLKSTI